MGTSVYIYVVTVMDMIISDRVVLLVHRQHFHTSMCMNTSHRLPRSLSSHTSFLVSFAHLKQFY